MAKHIKTDVDVDITSIDEVSQDVIIDKTKLIGEINENVTIQVKETNGKAVCIQPWYAIREPEAEADWVKVPYSSGQDYWDIPANGNDIITIDIAYGKRWFRLTGWLETVGPAKVQVDVVVE